MVFVVNKQVWQGISLFKQINEVPSEELLEQSIKSQWKEHRHKKQIGQMDYEVSKEFSSP